MSSTFARGLAILSAITDHHAPMSMSEISASTNLPLSTVYRYVTEAVDEGYVERRGSMYSPGHRLKIPDSVTDGQALVEAARPHLRRLAQQSGETALLTRLVGDRAVVAAQARPADDGVVFPIGQPLPLHAGASKRTLLAFGPEHLRSAALAAPLPRYTARTPDATTLRRLLETTRRDGTGISLGEFIPGTHAIAVPLLDGSNVATLCVSGLAFRRGKQWREDTVRALRRAAADIVAA